MSGRRHNFAGPNVVSFVASSSCGLSGAALLPPILDFHDSTIAALSTRGTVSGPADHSRGVDFLLAQSPVVSTSGTTTYPARGPYYYFPSNYTRSRFMSATAVRSGTWFSTTVAY